MTTSTATAIMCWVLVGTVGLTPAAFLTSPQVRDAAVVATTGTAEISGTVVTDDATPAPVRRATIRLTGAALGSSLTTVTDDGGRFAFARLPAGRYSLSAAKGGYLSAAYGSNRPGGPGTPLTVGDGQHVTGLRVRLLTGSVIAGTVRDEKGRPVPDVTVSVLQETWDSGERTLELPSLGASRVTDDRGSYRLYGLPPGEYLVSATWPTSWNPGGTGRTNIHQITGADVQRAQQLLRGASVPGAVPTVGAPPPAVTVAYVPVYFPSAIALADAVTITLGPHEERSGIDVQLRMAHPASINGVTTGPDGAPMAGVKVNVMDAGPSSVPGMVFPVVASTISGRDGKFVMSGIAPGHYAVEGWASVSREGSPISGSAPTSISGVADVVVDGVDVTTSIGLALLGHVSGRIAFEGTSAPPDVTGVPLVLQQVPPMVRRPGAPGPDGTFVFSNVVAGAYRLTLRQSPPVGWMGWMLKSVMVKGVDVSDMPLQITPNENVENVVITFTDRHTEISGTLRNAAGQPTPDYVLIVYSADQRFRVARTRRTRQVRPGTDGTFIVRDLPPGEYLISALTDVNDGQWNDPAFLAELASRQPIKVTLADGEKRVQDIRVGGGSQRIRLPGILRNGVSRIAEGLRSAGVTVDGKVVEDVNGKFAWVVDPEGNRIEVWEPKPGY